MARMTEEELNKMRFSYNIVPVSGLMYAEIRASWQEVKELKAENEEIWEASGYLRGAIRSHPDFEPELGKLEKENANLKEQVAEGEEAYRTLNKMAALLLEINYEWQDLEG